MSSVLGRIGSMVVHAEEAEIILHRFIERSGGATSWKLVFVSLRGEDRSSDRILRIDASIDHELIAQIRRTFAIRSRIRITVRIHTHDRSF
jgi:hypothetical protein